MMKTFCFNSSSVNLKSEYQTGNKTCPSSHVTGQNALNPKLFQLNPQQNPSWTLSLVSLVMKVMK